MSIFGNFNNQGLDNDVVFEEMCCQLFETWGARTMQFGSGWEYSTFAVTAATEALRRSGTM